MAVLSSQRPGRGQRRWLRGSVGVDLVEVTVTVVAAAATGPGVVVVGLGAVRRGPDHDLVAAGEVRPVAGHPDMPAVITAGHRLAIRHGPGTFIVALSVPYQNPVGLSPARAAARTRRPGQPRPPRRIIARCLAGPVRG